MQKGDLNTNVYQIKDYVLLLAVIVSMVFVIVGAISIISGMAKSVKEAGMMAMPLVVVVMVGSAGTVFGNASTSEIWNFFVPFYNCIKCMTEIFLFRLTPSHFTITIAVNIVYTITMIIILSKLFDNERIVYC